MAKNRFYLDWKATPDEVVVSKVNKILGNHGLEFKLIKTKHLTDEYGFRLVSLDPRIDPDAIDPDPGLLYRVIHGSE
jgi:hypothetical protein